MTPDVVADLAARTAIAEDLDDTLVVEAAAGTGKTTALVERMVRVLATGRATIDGLVGVTFTEKAAGELKLRLREQLEAGRASADTPPAHRVRIEEALAHLEEAHIGTIHGFCADLLRERPVEAGVDPLFTVLTEPQARRMFDEAFGPWFEQALEDPPEGIRRALRRSTRPGAAGAAGEGDAEGPVARLRRAGWEFAEWRDFLAPWSRPSFDRAAHIRQVLEAVDAFAAETVDPASSRDVLYLDVAAARRTSAECISLRQVDDVDGLEGLLTELSRDQTFRRARKGSGPLYKPGVTRAEVMAHHQQLVADLDAFRVVADADLAACLQQDLSGSVAAYEASKAGLGALDFLDLLVRARDLVRRDAQVRADFQARFTRIFVDEFQDTDPLQAELLLLLAADDSSVADWTVAVPRRGALFIVGDPKQSIYRFRRADVGIYQRVVNRLADTGARRVVLSTSFRSVPNVQRFVNAAFGRRMREDPDVLQAAYIPLDPWRAALDDQPSVVALPVPRPYGVRRLSAVSVEASLPDAVGAFVHWLVTESEWQVLDRDGERRLVRAGDVCVLFRRFVSFGTDMTRPYLDALEARGLPHVLVGGRAFHGREEIETVRAALTAIEWPDDELAVFATLRGALFAIGDDALLEYRHLFPRGLHPLRAPADLPPHLAPIGEALALLAGWHARRNRRPVAETVTDVLAATRAHVGFALRRGGEQVLANVLHIAELARQYERHEGLSFRGFVEALREAAEAGDAPDAPIVEEGGEGVQLMTVHKAKGLEFPVVILADITAKLATTEPSRYLDTERGLCALRVGGWSPWDLVTQQPIEHARDVEEGVRLAYVAATRARDLLVVPAVGDDEYPPSGWVTPLAAAAYPPLGARRDGTPHPRVPAFSRDSVLERPDAEGPGPSTVSPGRHALADPLTGDPYDVVWWDPSRLTLDVPPPIGLRRHEVIERGVPESVVEAGLRRVSDWQAERASAIAGSSRPSVQVMTATEWAASAAVGPQGDVEIVSLAQQDMRPAGPRFGTIVHGVLAAMSLEADVDDTRPLAEACARLVGGTEEETAAAVVVAQGVRQLDIWREACRVAREAPHRVWRETPVTAVVDDLLVEGVVDLAYELHAVVTVVDFKTDRPSTQGVDIYRRQVRLYAHAIGRATGRPTRAVLLHV